MSPTLASFPLFFFVRPLPPLAGSAYCPAELGYDTCAPAGVDPFGGTLGFDNAVQATSTIFQVVTLDNWTNAMYMLQDAVTFWIWPFFFLVVILGTWFTLNLVLVVVATQFKVTKHR